MITVHASADSDRKYQNVGDAPQDRSRMRDLVKPWPDPLNFDDSLIGVLIQPARRTRSPTTVHSHERPSANAYHIPRSRTGGNDAHIATVPRCRHARCLHPTTTDDRRNTIRILWHLAHSDIHDPGTDDSLPQWYSSFLLY